MGEDKLHEFATSGHADAVGERIPAQLGYFSRLVSRAEAHIDSMIAKDSSIIHKLRKLDQWMKRNKVVQDPLMNQIIILIGISLMGSAVIIGIAFACVTLYSKYENRQR